MDDQSVAVGDDTYDIHCGVDMPMHDLSSAPATRLAECEQLCTEHNQPAAETLCAAVVFRIDQQFCYLKYDWNADAVIHESNANAAIREVAPVSSSVSSAASTTSVSTMP